MKKYFILNWVLNIAVIFVVFLSVTIAANIEYEMLPIIVTAVTFGTCTKVASSLMFVLWMKREHVIFIDRTTIISHETDKIEHL